MNKENEELEKTDVIDTETDDVDNISDVTRKIDLNDLYDGAINNTVIIDPVTQDELLYKKKKPNKFIILVVITILTLLVVYYITNKSDLPVNEREVTPVTTSSKAAINNGFINCTYSSKSDAQSEDVSYMFTYKENKIVVQSFEYSVKYLTDSISDVAKNLKDEYEALYTNNSNLIGVSNKFNTNSKGFTYTSSINYDKVDFNQIKVEDTKTVLFIKPEENDTVKSINDNYTKKGFSCTITKEE